ncbi:MAG TPA: DUF222 domain-containing protein [Acidimicrobiales bacterium]|nr:DUF222 domain-containing protein [Acidimicrobiales bacterium]
MCNRLNEVLSSARGIISSLDIASLSPDQVATTFEVGAELEKLGASLKVLVAPKVGQSGAWARAGHRSPEEWMARTAGSSVGAAKAIFETGRKLEALPATASVVKSGVLSLAQAAAVAEAASADPGAETKLLEAAASESLKVLQDKSRRVVLDSRGSVEERYARQRKLRGVSSWIDEDGMTAGRFRFTPEIGAAFMSKLRAETDRHYRQGCKEGRPDSPGNYAADALAALVMGEGLIGTNSRSSGAEVVVLVSRDALLRGTVDSDSDELCEVPGFGAIPVSRAREMLDDCFLKGVLVDGTKIVTVKHFGRHRPAELHTALLVRSVLEDGQVMCKVEGCGHTARIQWDHAQPFALGGATAEWNINPMCGFDNREKEAGRVVRTPDGRWVRTAAVARMWTPP